MDQPNFYAVIPANVRYCKELEPSAKLLYGEITALCSKEGYCWATNQYFAELYEVEIRTIQRWIQSLKELDFIDIEIFSEGIQKTRKIWVSPEIKKMFASRQKCHDVTTKMSPRHDKNVVCINTASNTEQKEVVCPSDPPPVKNSFKSEEINPAVEKQTTDGKVLRVEKEAIFRLAIQERKTWTTQEIEDAWKILVDYSGRVNSPMKFIEGTIENLRKKQNFEKMSNKKGENTRNNKNSQNRCGRVPTQEDLDMIEQPSLFLDYLKKTND